ncbi:MULTISPECIES: hypothetical protein [Pseudomonas]|uniref:hypothetical protein n=1 Tax=Pseudomonas TaxID=286 RepID=UPI000710D5DB|nr:MULTISPECIES: hypothetical protein [Pseudomonas]KQW19696.1 hypothetical protein ASC85_07535 [Pseudomonas sp. Root401]WHS57606.1 hypothetical protein QLH64_30095 [Pseudomonas brassicacearum]
MRIYSTAQASDLLTVKRQGQKVAEAWMEQRGLSHVTVRAIKRVDGFGKHVQWGFVVLESIFDSYLCHYRFDRARLEITGEVTLSAVCREYLQCPDRLLALVESRNSRWRDLNRTYLEAVRLFKANVFAGDVKVFIKKPYENRQYSEPFFVLTKCSGQWFGIDCYDEKRPLNIGTKDVIDHCPILVDEGSLKPMAVHGLAPDCVNVAGVIYKQDGLHSTLLGRPEKPFDVVTERLSHFMQPVMSLEPEFAWS